MRKYPKYKIKDDNYWFDSVPFDWDIIALKHITYSVKTGSTPSTKERKYYEEGEIDWYTPEDISSLILSDSKKKTTKLAIQDGELKLFKANSLLLVGIGATIGKVGLLTKDATSNQQINSVFFNKKLTPKYGLYFFYSIAKIMNEFSSTSTMGIFNQSKTKAIYVPVPPLQEQNAITHYLDYKTGQIDRFIANRQKQIELLKEQKAGIINKAVTKGINPNAKMKDSGIEWIEKIPENWSVWKLKFLTKKISKGTTPSTEGRDILELGAIRYLKAENITPDGISFLPEFFIDEETNQILKRSQLQKNDILFVIAGATIGKASIITEEFIPANTNQAVCFIRLKKIVLPELILHQLQACYIKNKMSVESVVAAQPNISMENIGNFQIFLPPIQEQNILLKYIKEEAANFDTLISKYQKQIDLMTEYRASLISQAVTGKIDVREWEPKREAV